MGAASPQAQERNTPQADAAWAKGPPRAGLESCGTAGLKAGAAGTAGPQSGEP